MIKSAYIHIPFCNSICSYCDFCKLYYNKKLISNYLKALKEEVENNYKKEKLDTIYIGGGTPSALSLKELEELFSIIKIFNMTSAYEFTFECNYEDITDELLSFLKNKKVNRISIGMQTFNKKYEGFLERKINKKKMLESVKIAKKYFDNINVDLLYGFDNEDMDELKDDLDIILSLKISHISTYCLILEEHTKLYVKNVKEESEDLQHDMYYKIVQTLKKRGYSHYEISNFSKDGYESKHNLVYWNNYNYYGFGLGASGFINNMRYNNTRNIYDYINGKYVHDYEIIDKEQMIKDEVMLNLRKICGINKKEFYNKYKIDFKDVFDIKFLIDNKLIIESNTNIYIPEDKLFISNEIIIRILDGYRNI